MSRRRYNDGSAYLEKLTEALAEGNVAHVRANLPRLEALIVRLRRRRSAADSLLVQSQAIIGAVGARKSPKA